MKIDFIGIFKKSVYSNTYIYNLIDYISRYIYLHPTFGVSTNDVIILFNYYLQANLKLYVIYMDAGLYFISQKLRIYFQKKDITIIFTFSIFYKSIDIMEKSNNIL